MSQEGNRLIIKPPSEAIWHGLRIQDVTSTESAALFGQSPYATELELWYRKRDKLIIEFEGNERTEWGTALQDSIARRIGQRYGVKVERIEDYMRIIDARMGASFDFEITKVERVVNDSILAAMFADYGAGILEIKNVDRLVFRDSWTVNEDKSIEAPGHIEIQLQHQLHVRDRNWGAIGVLVGGNTHYLVIRKRDVEVGAALEARIRSFWQSINADEPPTAIYPGDAAFVAKLYGYAEPGKVFDGRGHEELAALADEYRQAADREKHAKEDKDVSKAKMLTIIGDAERATLDRYTITAGVVGPARIEYDREGYRNWKVTPKRRTA